MHLCVNSDYVFCKKMKKDGLSLCFLIVLTLIHTNQSTEPTNKCAWTVLASSPANETEIKSVSKLWTLGPKTALKGEGPLARRVNFSFSFINII